METSTSTHATTYRLNLQKGISNIGSHPANDIVIDDPRVQPFHLILDHRKKPYQIIPLSPESNIRLNGIAIAGNDPIEVKDLNQVQFNGFAFHTNSGPAGAETGEIEITPPRFQTEASSAYEVLPVLPEEQLQGPSAPANLTGLEKTAQPRQFSPALKDDIILVTLVEVNQQVDVETPAVYRLSVINAGPIVASFDVRVEGLPQEWVRISPRKLNLNESGRAETEIQICAPRDPSSTAASYPIQFSISSPNYPDHVGQADSTYVLNPYYEYTLGNLDPKQRSASYNKRVGTVAFPISNMGNSPEIYQVSATDDENGLLFEFPQPDQTRLARQAEVKVGAGETKTVPMVINPIRRHIFRMRGRQYHYNVHARQAEQESGQLVSGSFTSQPLLGFFSALLIVAIAAVAVFFLMRPRIIEFYAVKDIVEKGQAVTLRWKVSFFTRDLIIEGIPDPIQGTQSQVSTMPTSVASTYTLVASNWLSRTLRMPDLRSAPVTVLTIPAPPAITTFSVDKNEAFVGDTVKAKWSIGNADQAYLTVDGITTILAAENFNGELPITLARDTLVVLEAKNNAGSLVRSEFLRARQPSILIEEFSLSKTTITLGDPVTIKWKVSGIGAESVMIAPFEEPLPLTGELTFYPKESMEFVMSVENRDLKEIRLLPVGVLPPGAPPEPPAISFFKAAPEERVGEGTVEFSWSVSGTTDKIEITNSAGLVAGALPAQGFKSTLVKQTTNFIMTAYNKTVSSSAIVEVKIKPDLMPTQVLIHSTIPNSSIMRGETMVVYFSVKPMVNGLPVEDVIAAKLPEVSGKVVVTDGFDTCEAELPKTSCVITLNTSSANKKLTATYYGDATYARRTSPPYPETGLIMVMGTPTTFVSPPTFSIDPVNPGELTKLTFLLGPLDPSKLDPVSGEVQVFEIINSEEAATPLCRVNLGGVVGFPNQGTASCMISFPTSGPKILRVKYMGNAVYDGVVTTTPEFATLVVNLGPTIPQITTNLTAPTVTGQPLSVSVLVQATGTAVGTPSGQVQIYDNTNPAASCLATLTDGIGTCDIVFTLAGPRQVLAHYVGDANFAPSDSGTVLHPVNQAATSTIFTSFPAPTQVGQTVTFGFKSEILAPGTGTLTGEAVVMDGINEVCRIAHVNNGVGTCSGVVLTSAAKAYRVIYDPADAAEPDPNFATSESPATSYLPLLSGTKFTVFSQSASEGINPSTVTYTVGVIADPVSAIAPSGTVRVVVESTPKFCDIVVPSADQTCPITFDMDGVWTVRAYFLANANYTASQSNPLQYTVKKDSTVTVVSVNPSSVLIDQPVLFTVTVTPLTPSGVVPTGTVIVTINPGNQICTVTLNKDADGNPAPDYQGSCRKTFNKAASLSVTAQYLGDPLFVISQTASSVPLTVNRAPTTTEILSISPVSPLLGQAFTVNFKVTKAGPNSYASGPTGSVRVSASASEFCTGAVLGDGTGSCQLTLTSSGLRNLTAVYTETADVLRFQDGVDSTSAAFPVNVINANTTIVAHVTRKNTTSPDINDAVINEPIRVNFTVTTQGSSIIPAQGLVTVTADAPGETCQGLSSTIDGTGFCELKLTKTGSPRTLTITYPNTTGFITSSTTYMVTVSQATVTLSLSASPGTIYVGQVLTYNAVVTPVPRSEGGPVGVVALTAVSGANTATGSCAALTVGTSNSTSSCTIDFRNPGTWTLTLVYSDAGGQYEPLTLSPAPTATVSKDTTTTSITLSAGPYVVDSTINFTVRVAAGNSTTVLLTLPTPLTFTLNPPGGSGLDETAITCGTATIGFDGAAPNKAYITSSCSFTPDVKGDWKITASYPEDANFVTSTSIQTTITVIPLPTPMTLSRTAPAGTDYYVSQSYTFTASINYTKNAPSGNVVFSSTGNTLPPACASVAWVNDSPNKKVTAACTIPMTTLGATTVTAAYAGDKKFEAALDQTLSFTVVKIPTVLAATLNPLPVPIGDPFVFRDPEESITFTFSVTANPAIATVEGGDITLQTIPAGLFTTPQSCTVVGGSCTITANLPSTASPGAKVFSASYAGTGTFITNSMDLGTLMVRYPSTVRYLSSTEQGIYNYWDWNVVFTDNYLAVEVLTDASNLNPFLNGRDTVKVEFTELTDPPSTISPVTLNYAGSVDYGGGVYHIFARKDNINYPLTINYDSITVTFPSTSNPTTRPFTPVTFTNYTIPGKEIYGPLYP